MIASKSISIIVRTFNEERWVEHCLGMLSKQRLKPDEIILVDSGSTDLTVSRALKYDAKLVRYEGVYKPGRAINLGIENSSGEFLVILSAHCIPTSDNWLENLIRPFCDARIAGVYGRQEPLEYSADADKRDLLMLFGLDPKVQFKDPFFHNANSCIRRTVWNDIAFDDTVDHIEDRVWGQQVLNSGMCLAYVPDASVYHYHGVHQNNDPERLKGVVQILENLSESSEQGQKCLSDNFARSDKTVFILPFRSDGLCNGFDQMIFSTLRKASESKLFDEIVCVVDSDMDQTESLVAAGASEVLIRPKSLAEKFVALEQVVKFAIMKLAAEEKFFDLIVFGEVNYPLREYNAVGQMIEVVRAGFSEAVVAAVSEHRGVRLNGKLYKSPVPRFFDDREVEVLVPGIALVCRSGKFLDGSFDWDSVDRFPVNARKCAVMIDSEGTYKELKAVLNI